MRPQPNRHLLTHLQLHRGAEATASLCWHELVYGISRLPEGARRRRFEEYLRDELAHHLTVLPYDLPTASWHAEERARLEASGKTPPFVDGQIAAIAATRDLVLVTRNVKDFSSFHDLQTVSWFRAPRRRR